MYSVILVDDELVAVNALRNRVNWGKYNVNKVYIARSMKQAQSVYLEHDIDIMLCDIEMPHASGLDLFEWVKGFYPHVECIYVSCHPDYKYIRRAMKLGSFDYILKPVDYQELDGLMEQVIERIETKKKRTNAIENLDTTLENNADDLEREADNDPMISKIKEHIKKNIQNDICINDISNFVHLNPNYLMRLFRSRTNKSIVEYITDLRMEKAKELLMQTEDTVQQIAEQVGYGNYSYFTRLFKKRTDMSPNAYRKNKRG